MKNQIAFLLVSFLVVFNACQKENLPPENGNGNPNPIDTTNFPIDTTVNPIDTTPNPPTPTEPIPVPLIDPFAMKEHFSTYKNAYPKVEPVYGQATTEFGKLTFWLPNESGYVYVRIQNHYLKAVGDLKCVAIDKDSAAIVPDSVAFSTVNGLEKRLVSGGLKVENGKFVLRLRYNGVNQYQEVFYRDTPSPKTLDRADYLGGFSCYSALGSFKQMNFEVLADSTADGVVVQNFEKPGSSTQGLVEDETLKMEGFQLLNSPDSIPNLSPKLVGRVLTTTFSMHGPGHSPWLASSGRIYVCFKN